MDITRPTHSYSTGYWQAIPDIGEGTYICSALSLFQESLKVRVSLDPCLTVYHMDNTGYRICVRVLFLELQHNTESIVSHIQHRYCVSNDVNSYVCCF